MQYIFFRTAFVFISVFFFAHIALAVSFTDTTDEPASQAIESLRADGIVEGYADGSYKPKQPINRAEFLAILLRASTSESDIDDLLMRIRMMSFPDVQSDHWYWRYVMYARARGIIEGYPDGLFRPEQSVNIAEAAKIASHVFGVSPMFIQCFHAPCETEWWGPYVRALESRGALPNDAWTRTARNFTRGEMAIMTDILRQDTDPFACVRGGCSGQLCISEADASGAVTTCEWRESYACYDTAVCERQSDGKCGWSMTAGLRTCLEAQ